MRYLLVLFLLFAMAGTAYADGPSFKLGFKLLADQIPQVVGEPLENEHWGDNGDSLQQTSKGLMVWRKADNWTAFTNGSRTWVNGPHGIQERGNGERFSWEMPVRPSVPGMIITGTDIRDKSVVGMKSTFSRGEQVAWLYYLEKPIGATSYKEVIISVGPDNREMIYHQQYVDCLPEWVAFSNYKQLEKWDIGNYRIRIYVGNNVVANGQFSVVK